MRYRTFMLFVIAIVTIFSLCGCAATQIAMEHKNLDVQTKMSDTIFLSPEELGDKTVWVDLKNTSDKDVDLGGIISTLQARGYRIVSSYKEPHNLRLQVNLLQAEKTSLSAAQQSLLNGYGGALVGGVAGASIGSRGGYGTAAAGGIGGALLGGLIETMINASVKDVTYMMVTDVQVSAHSNKKVSQQMAGSIRQGTSTSLTQNVSDESDWIIYRTRIVSTANKVNLKFPQALPELEAGLNRVIGNIL
ncbi:MAG: complement resistance protein TraT [Patescibacteria group bacterium]|nr:complement resistance protein TraT [bacterium]MDZ4241119.1 complement resistance protein TraT [Patescibacteria group bacterium]